MVDDGFFDINYPCCTQATPTIPTAAEFPSTFTLAGQYGVISDCTLASDEAVTVTIDLHPHPGPIAPSTPLNSLGLPSCDELVFKITASSASLNLTLGPTPTSAFSRTNFVLGKFSRTYTIIEADQTIRQVWTYLVSGDGVFGATSTALLPPCFSPGIAPPSGTFSQVGFFGHIDISCAPTFGAPDTPNWKISLSLTHHDGCLSHQENPYYNARSIAGSPASKHIATSYHLVAPNNFNWLAGTAPAVEFDSAGGGFPLDAVRSTVSHSTTAQLGAVPPGFLPPCNKEALTGGHTAHVETGCGCGPPGTGNQQRLQVEGIAVCINTPGTNQIVSPFQSQPVADLPTGFQEEYLGIWSNTARYDVREVALFSVVGVMAYQDLCDNRFPKKDFHIVFGVHRDYSLSTVFNVPILFPHFTSSSPIFVTSLLDFGDNAQSSAAPFGERQAAGKPEYMNIIWMMAR